jgi:NADH-quinone oxidoreductase subunit E
MMLEVALWMLFAFFVGCIIGCLLYSLFGPGRPAKGGTSERTSDSVQAPSTSEASAVEKTSSGNGARNPARPAAPVGSRPLGIAKARDGKPDNLQRISGIGPKNERTLHKLGFFHFDQIAAWSDDEILWVDDHLKFSGRIASEEWTRQAGLLAEGKDEEFTKLYGTGGLRNKKGETESGERTRKS